MHKISAVGLFCCDKFEKNPKQKVIDLSKFKKKLDLVRACPDHLLGDRDHLLGQALTKSNRLLDDRLKDDQIRNGPSDLS